MHTMNMRQENQFTNNKHNNHDIQNVDLKKNHESDNDSDIKTFGLRYSKFVIDSKKPVSSIVNATQQATFSDSEESSDDEYTPITDKHSGSRYKLSSTLDDGIDTSNLYTDPRSSKMKSSYVPSLSKKSQETIMKASVLTPDIEQKHTLPPYQESIRAARKKRQLEKANSKGKNWFDMKAPEMTEEQKNDLSVLQMRSILNPKVFYKHNDLKALPKFFQMGRVVEDASDFYCARIPKNQRKQTLVDELLADEEFKKFNKRKYGEAVESTGKHHRKLKIAKRLKKKKVPTATLR